MMDIVSKPHFETCSTSGLWSWWLEGHIIEVSTTLLLNISHFEESISPSPPAIKHYFISYGQNTMEI